MTSEYRQTVPAGIARRCGPLVWPACRDDPTIGPGGWTAWLGVSIVVMPARPASSVFEVSRWVDGLLAARAEARATEPAG